MLHTAESIPQALRREREDSRRHVAESKVLAEEEWGEHMRYRRLGGEKVYTALAGLAVIY